MLLAVSATYPIMPVVDNSGIWLTDQILYLDTIITLCYACYAFIEVTASSNTSCLDFPYSGIVTDGFFRLSNSDSTFHQCQPMIFNWDSSFTAPASLIAITPSASSAGKVWEVFSVDEGEGGKTSDVWEKVNVTAGEQMLVTFPDSGPKGTLGR